VSASAAAQTRERERAHHRAVDREIARLRAAHEARQRFDAETRPPLPEPPIATLRERLAEPPRITPWRIERWQPVGSRVMLTAQFKSALDRRR
jgi:hypothetical protein